MSKPKPVFPSKMMRIPGDLVAPVRALVTVYIEQKRLSRYLDETVVLKPKDKGDKPA